MDPTGHFTKEEVIKFFGVKTWSDVEAFFKEGGLLEGRWGWLEILIRAQDWDELYAGTSQGEMERIGIFEVWGDSLRINSVVGGYTSWLEIAGQYDYYRIFRWEQTNWLVPQFLADPVYYTFETCAHKPDYQRFYPEKVDWPGALLDIAGVIADVFSSGMAGRAINALDVSYGGFGLVHDAIEEHNVKRYGFEADVLTGEDFEDFGLALVGFFPYVGTLADLYGLRRNFDQAIYGPWSW